MKTQIKKSLNVFFWWLDKFNKKAYVKYYPKYLKWLGININSSDTIDTWISPTVFFDSAQYDLIEIGKQVTISFDVAILIHDFSIKHAIRLLSNPPKIKHSLRQPVKIGNNVFIGARAMILPGTTIGDNCIIGGGSVVKGCYPAGSVIIGNPAHIICKTIDFGNKYQNQITKANTKINFSK